jgi:hypothetical protein
LTVFTEQPTSSAVRLFAVPCEASRTILAFFAAPAPAVVDLTVLSRISLSPGLKATAGAGLFATSDYPKQNHIRQLFT